jgi:hypothetical protein
MAEARCLALEPSAGLRGIVPAILPDAVDEQTHEVSPVFRDESISPAPARQPSWLHFCRAAMDVPPPKC